MQVAANRVAVPEMRPVQNVRYVPGPYRTPLSLPPIVSANKYPVFIRLRDALPRKYWRNQMFARRYQRAKELCPRYISQRTPSPGYTIRFIKRLCADVGKFSAKIATEGAGAEGLRNQWVRCGAGLMWGKWGLTRLWEEVESRRNRRG